jgi:hypothetical protein
MFCLIDFDLINYKYPAFLEYLETVDILWFKSVATNGSVERILSLYDGNSLVFKKDCVRN